MPEDPPHVGHGTARHFHAILDLALFGFRRLAEQHRDSEGGAGVRRGQPDETPGKIRRGGRCTVPRVGPRPVAFVVGRAHPNLVRGILGEAVYFRQRTVPVLWTVRPAPRGPFAPLQVVAIDRGPGVRGGRPDHPHGADRARQRAHARRVRLAGRFRRIGHRHRDRLRSAGGVGVRRLDRHLVGVVAVRVLGPLEVARDHGEHAGRPVDGKLGGVRAFRGPGEGGRPGDGRGRRGVGSVLGHGAVGQVGDGRPGRLRVRHTRWQGREQRRQQDAGEPRRAAPARTATQSVGQDLARSRRNAVAACVPCNMHHVRLVPDSFAAHMPHDHCPARRGQKATDRSQSEHDRILTSSPTACHVARAGL